MTGRLAIVGLGPHGADTRTPEASAELDGADAVYGYAPYVARVPDRPGLAKHASDNREEIDRARAALADAAAGRRVAIVSSGDPGVFAMASAVFEAIEHGEPGWRDLDVAVVPGISAMFAAAARAGAPLGHDFCAINLSDNLKPRALIERRLRLAADAGFAIALYNPVSKARPDGLAAALSLLAGQLPATTPVVFARALYDPARERVSVVPLSEAHAEPADMRTLVIVGTAETRMVPRGAARAFVYTPRRA